MQTFPARLSFRRSVRCVALLAFASAAAAVSAAAVPPWRLKPMAAQSLTLASEISPLANGALRPAEKAFLTKAVTLARLQLRLAELGASQALDADVRSHAEQLKSDNRQLIDGLTATMRRKGSGLSPVPEPTSPPDSYTRLAEVTGAEFDGEFVRVLAELHEDTIALFEQTLAEAKDDDVRELTAAQLPMLRAHRNRINELKKAFD